MKKNWLLMALLFACSFVNQLHAQSSEKDSLNITNRLYDDRPLVNPTSNEFSITEGFSIYPYVVKDELKIFGLDPAVKTHITVTAVYGKVIFESRSSGEEAYTANVSRILPGAYYVTIKEKKKTVMLKFLKQ
ncbi:T9SS type A sorting domain-containing protein [Panacibacter sp. DH6]|uniref:T9SS type A sorting domain-containing protein n=1 Tax=Panacibacter microcysteis TaxID=2793269 RepID=A0A931GWZ1_9BACT|nr:T9SS type A sorting domain-containing protein [Panacibacter microcysteis]MBG9377008.1 T9SS type A sorting domain-containing protein [Panacibacter microcysteis]